MVEIFYFRTKLVCEKKKNRPMGLEDTDSLGFVCRLRSLQGETKVEATLVSKASWQSKNDSRATSFRLSRPMTALLQRIGTVVWPAALQD